MVGLAVERTLLDVGDLAVERAVVIVVLRERAHALARRPSRRHGLRSEFIAGRENAAVAVAQRDVHAAGQRRVIDDEVRLAACSQCQRIGQHHAPFGVGVHDFDGGAVQRAHDFVLMVSTRTDVVA